MRGSLHRLTNGVALERGFGIAFWHAADVKPGSDKDRLPGEGRGNRGHRSFLSSFWLTQ